MSLAVKNIRAANLINTDDDGDSSDIFLDNFDTTDDEQDFQKEEE